MDYKQVGCNTTGSSNICSKRRGNNYMWDILLYSGRRSLLIIPIYVKWQRVISDHYHPKTWGRDEEVLTFGRVFVFFSCLVDLLQAALARKTARERAQSKKRSREWTATPAEKCATHPEGQIVSLCKTHIWCILRPQSIHSTSLRRTEMDISL